jgi:ADP-heptose:LPS heptosyltransferase
LPHVAWHSFQFEATAEPPLPGIATFGPLLKGFPNTAYALSGMDLVITVDTVLAHLAGALGLPTFLLLSFIPDWRWMLGREDSPWYPTVHLYRQPIPGDWDAVIRHMIRDLTSSN